MDAPEYFIMAGPTAVGKSGLALEVAERVGGEIVGADAFQIYDGLRLLSASPTAEDRARVPHHLVNCVPLAQAFDVAQWLALARAAVAGIRARGRVPIVCGGTGLYLRALLRGLDDLPPADPAVRAGLEELGEAALRERLLALEPDTAVDPLNPRRVLRALEIHALTGELPGSRQRWKTAVAKPRGVFLQRDRTKLLERVARRTRALFAGGALAEADAVPESAIGPTAAKMLGLELLRACRAGRLSAAEAEERLNIATRQYTKRQATWFRKEPALMPLDLGQVADPVAAIAAMIEAARMSPPATGNGIE